MVIDEDKSGADGKMESLVSESNVEDNISNTVPGDYGLTCFDGDTSKVSLNSPSLSFV